MKSRTSDSLVPADSRRRLSAFVWIGIAVSCLAFCSRGLFAQSTARPKAGEGAGRVAPNTAISTASDNRKTSRGPRAEALREESAIEEGNAQPAEPSAIAGFQPEQLVSPGGLSSTLNLMIVLTVLSLAPSILIMTTCFIRFIIVTSLLRQALGTQQLPPNQVLVALCLFMTFMVMSPVWQRSYDEGIKPYSNPEPDRPQPTLAETFTNTAAPIRAFMYDQIKHANNIDTIWMFLDYQFPATDAESGEERVLPSNDNEIPLPTLISSYILSELKVAFVIGFQIFLPFLVIDMVVSTVLMSMGMMMLPPTLVSFPFKLLLFVLIDGWALSVGMLLNSVRLSGAGDMDLDSAIDLVRNATFLALMVGAPILIVSMVVGLAISILQAVTQIQEQTLNLVPKIALMTVTMLVILPWMIQRVMEYTTALFLDIPSTI